MKRLLLFIVFMGVSLCYSEVKAQNTRDYGYSTQKTEDAIISASPNPTRDVLVVRAKDANLKIKNISFYSILGVQVANYSINMNAAEINLERLRPGKYLMKYTLSDNTQKIKQIIKQ